MNECIICLEPYTDDNPKTLEHIIPEFLGGKLTKEMVCKHCNSSMGGDFEGRLSNNPLFKLPRHIHDISGKAGIGREVHPFTGMHKLDDGRIFRIYPDGKSELVSKIDVNSDEDNNNQFQFNVEVDEANEEDLEKLVFKKLERLSKKHGINYSKEAITESVNKAIKESKKRKSSLDNPAIKIDASFDLDDLRLLYIKIAYEMAFHVFGETYLNDPVAKTLRLSLCDLKVHEKVMNNVLEADHETTKALFEDGYHWIFFMKNLCYIRLYSMVGTVVFSSRNDFVTDDVYRFCYKTISVDVLKLIPMLDELVKKTNGLKSNSSL